MKMEIFEPISFVTILFFAVLFGKPQLTLSLYAELFLIYIAVYFIHRAKIMGNK